MADAERGEPVRAIGGVAPCGSEGMGDARRAVASARGTEPEMDLGAWDSGAGDVDIGAVSELFAGREVILGGDCAVEVDKLSRSPYRHISKRVG